MTLTASQIAEIQAKVAANTQPTAVTLDGKTYSVPYRIAAAVRSYRRAGRIDGSRAASLNSARETHSELAAALGVSFTTARRIVQSMK